MGAPCCPYGTLYNGGGAPDSWDSVLEEMSTFDYDMLAEIDGRTLAAALAAAVDDTWAVGTEVGNSVVVLVVRSVGPESEILG